MTFLKAEFVFCEYIRVQFIAAVSLFFSILLTILFCLIWASIWAWDCFWPYDIAISKNNSHIVAELVSDKEVNKLERRVNHVTDR